MFYYVLAAVDHWLKKSHKKVIKGDNIYDFKNLNESNLSERQLQHSGTIKLATEQK